MFLSFIGQLDTKRKMTKNLKPMKQIISISDVTIFEGDNDDIHIHCITLYYAYQEISWKPGKTSKF